LTFINKPDAMHSAISRIRMPFEYFGVCRDEHAAPHGSSAYLAMPIFLAYEGGRNALGFVLR